MLTLEFKLEKGRLKLTAISMISCNTTFPVISVSLPRPAAEEHQTQKPPNVFVLVTWWGALGAEAVHCVEDRHGCRPERYPPRPTR